MNDSKAMHNQISIISEENRVRGFDPIRFIRKTKEGPRLDLKIKKLWFRYKYPNGRIKLNPLSITDQLAIIEARIYFNKDDEEPASTYTAKKENCNTPGGLYVEMAQYCAIDEALSAAGFGIKITTASGSKIIPSDATTSVAPTVVTPPNVSTQTTSDVEKEADSPKSNVKAEACDENIKTSEATASEDIVQTQISQEPISLSNAKEEIRNADDSTSEVPAVAVPLQDNATSEKTVIENSPASVVDNSSEEITEITEEQAALPYTKDMAVEDICALMSVEEAGNIVVPIGSCKNWTLSQVADRRPFSLKWYLTGYQGDDNILRAGAAIMQKLLDSKAA